jgi:hypothetical protein
MARQPLPTTGRPRKSLWKIRVIEYSRAALIIAFLLALLLPAYQTTNRRQRDSSRRDLKILGIAIHNYHDVHSTLPVSTFTDTEGNPLHGWETSLLPFVDAPDLYEKISRDEPWYDPANQAISKQPIDFYLNPEISTTTDSEGYALNHYSANSRILQRDKALAFKDITDGFSNTIVFGEISAGFQPWAAPGNTRDPALGINHGPRTFGGSRPEGGLFTLMDGSVRYLSTDIDPQVLKALATPDGGEELPPVW